MKMILCGGLLMLTLTVRCQTFDEWFQQKKTRIRYLEEQLAALNDLLATVKKGDQLVEKGLANIRDFKNGEFSLHSNYIGSLGTVLFAVGGGPEVETILTLQSSLKNQIEAAIQYWQAQRSKSIP